MPFAHVNGTKLNYEITGTGTPIVFFHPPLLTSQNFAYQREQLSGQFQVITFDFRGHGASKSSERPFSYALIVEDLRQLLDYLGIEKVFLCGYSTGGALVLEALLTYPKRFLGGIVVSGMSELTDIYNKSRLWLASWMAGSGPLMKLLKKAITFGNADNENTYHSLYESSLSDAANDVKSYYEQSLTYTCTRRLRSIQHPILLIYGQKDHTFHRYANLLHAELPHSSLYFIKDAKHQIPTKNPSRMNDLIRLWVDSLEDIQTQRVLLDLAIAKKLNPDMYGEDIQESQAPLH
ncbi:MULTISPECIES: alpha/beta fold hydrolase [unclassified Paenibacillus]|uniref:alpha/beta fold hydrolase n=1 Tax=unclassified Paenibacillus TaxID=185978 RepID=UPI00278370DE|nr:MULTISPECIES: alpha/beta hydrolase [unclassified Paenibacillus]MDQ0901666.1 pimeloyl-ACP methyl ester carboxylesterase [Paenibacillus sp. V4I7]MDQ0919832.1 pimeloyl-ACP methyl ester carboxylesterase [Paenibacillus sp. V4I5]